MKALVISIVLAIAIVGCVPKVVLPKDLCVKYELAWHTSPAAIPTQTACVCTEDVYVGLDAILDTLVTFPDTITLKGIMAPSECKPDAEKVPVNEGDASVKELLSQ